HKPCPLRVVVAGITWPVLRFHRALVATLAMVRIALNRLRNGPLHKRGASDSAEVACCAHVGVEAGSIADGDGLDVRRTLLVREKAVDQSEPRAGLAGVEVEVNLAAVAEVGGAGALLELEPCDLTVGDALEQREHGHRDRV